MARGATGTSHSALRRGLTWGLIAVVACKDRVPLPLVITHVTIVDVERGTLLPDRTIVIRDGRIEQVDTTPRVTRPPQSQTLDARNQFVMPGLWDMHVHLQDARIAVQLLRWGITGARVMSGGLDTTLALRDATRREPTRGPRLLVAGLALHGRESLASDTGLALVSSADDGRRAVDSLARRGVDFIKVHEGLSREAWFAIARAARGHRLPLAGHVPSGLTPREVADSGMRGIEHLEFLPDRCLVVFDSTARAHDAPPPSGCRRRELAVLFDRLYRRAVWLDPTIGSFRVFAPRQFPSILAGFTDLARQLRAADLPIMTGTDLGSAGIVPGESLHDELELLVAAGYAPVEALRAATLVPAMYMDAADTLGRVEAGFVADLLMLDANPLADIRHTRRIAAVIRAGVLMNRPDQQ